MATLYVGYHMLPHWRGLRIVKTLIFSNILSHFSSKIDCKDQNGYGASIKPDIGAGPVSAMTAAGWGGSPGSVGGAGAGGVSGGRVGVTTPDTMARYTPSSVDQAARDRAWMNTCSSLSAAAQASVITSRCHKHG